MRELLREGWIGNPEQLCRVRRVELREGTARGCAVIEAETAGGLSLDILPDTGLDIGQVRFRGFNMTYLSKNGYDSPAADLPYEEEFLHTFPGGLLYTCGLRSAGPAHRDGGEWHPLHGRYHGLAAGNISAGVEGEEIVVRGTVRETALFGHVLELRRTIRIPVEGARITVEDELTNLTPRPEEFMVVYHCNFGYPLLTDRARLILPEERETIPRTPFAATGLDRQCTFERPVDGEEERVFFQKMKKDFRASVQNPDLGVEVCLTWSGGTLPILSEWRSMASGDYVLGLEPTNSYICGRGPERDHGTLPVLGAFETVRHKVEFQFTRTEER